MYVCLFVCMYVHMYVLEWMNQRKNDGMLYVRESAVAKRRARSQLKVNMYKYIYNTTQSPKKKQSPFNK